MSSITLPPIYGPNPGKVKDFVAAFGNPVHSVPYNALQWEQSAYREAGDAEEKLLTYGTSLARLQAAGFERHPRPAEVFSILADSLEGKLKPAEKSIADDMLSSYEEWLSAAVEVTQRRNNQILTVYIDPENIVWNGRLYEVRGTLKYSEKQEFDITGIPLQTSVDLKEFPDAFVQYVYSRSFADLPQEMQTRRYRKAEVYLPPCGIVRPVGRGYFYGFSINYFVDGASRGVVVVGAKKFHINS